MAQQHLTAKVADIATTGKPLVVLLKGAGKDSSMMEMILRTSGLATLRDQATLFVLSALDQTTISMSPITEGLQKAALPALNLSDLPVIIVLDGSGKAIQLIRGLVTAGELQQSLTQAMTAFQTKAGSKQPHTTKQTSVQTQQKSAAIQAQQSQKSKGPATPATNESRLLKPAEQMSTPPQSKSQATVPAATMQEPSAPSEKPVADPNQPVQLQIYLPDGQAVRSSFRGSTTLHEVYQYVCQQMPEASSSSYSIVSLHLGKEFAAADQHRTLAELGVQSLTSLRLHYKQSPSGSTGSFIEQLMQLLTKLHPTNLLRWILSLFTAGGSASPSNRNSESQAMQPETQAPGSTTGRQSSASQPVRRRPARSGQVHTVHDTGPQSNSDDPDSNKYWNGNSTQFDAQFFW